MTELKDINTPDDLIKRSLAIVHKITEEVEYSFLWLAAGQQAGAGAAALLLSYVVLVVERLQAAFEQFVEVALKTTGYFGGELLQ